jgi:hypothetical protein
MTPDSHPFSTLAAAALLFTTALAAPTPAHAQPPAHSPCALLTPAQIKTVLDTPIIAGKPGGAGANGTGDCTWTDATGATRVYLSLKEPGTDYKSFRDSMQATGRLVPVTGLSADAFYIASTGTGAALYALKGKYLMLITVDGIGFTKSQNEAAERGLATQILPKL